MVPGDKSISHRAFLINALGEGRCRIRGAVDAEDVRASRSLIQALGVQLELTSEGWLLQTHALHEPDQVIDCGNSGTTMRLGAAVCVHQPGIAVLTGDASLRRRPMSRILKPLEQLGHTVLAAGSGRLAPLVVRGGGDRREQVVATQVASAQVKSAVLLAARDLGVQHVEPALSRNHTELQLRRMGAKLSEELVLEPGPWTCVDVDVPGDLSSAAFWLVAGAVVPGSNIELPNIGLNPTRTGVLQALLQMGASIEVNHHHVEGESAGHLTIHGSALRGIEITGELALRCLDELPVLAVAAAFADGETVIRDAGELRHKESDRIERVVRGLRAMGAQVEEHPDGMVIEGGGLPGGGVVDAEGDHRLAMAFAVAGLAAPGGVTLRNADVVETSYPLFFIELRRLVGAG